MTLLPNKDLTVCWQVRDKNQRNDNTRHANNLRLRISNRDDSQQDEQRTQLGLVKYRTGARGLENSLTPVRLPERLKSKQTLDVNLCAEMEPKQIWALPSCAIQIIWRQICASMNSFPFTHLFWRAPHLSIKTFNPSTPPFFFYSVKTLVNTFIWKMYHLNVLRGFKY